MFVVIVSVLAFVASVWGCEVPPQFWCDNVQVAKDCQVLEQCETFVWSRERTTAAAPVQLTLYYESLCPDCKEFFQRQLTPTFSKVPSIVDLQLVPYGNARESQEGEKWVFQCQHGEEECTGNLLETCILALNKGNMSQAFPLISCMEASDDMPKHSVYTCGKKLSVDVAPVVTCAQSSMGNKLEHEMAVLTDKLNPPHRYVPWITVNGVHTEPLQQQAQSDLLKLICDTYQGSKPSGCSASVKSLIHQSPHVLRNDIL